MGKTTKKVLREEWDRLKKALGKLIKPEQQPQPQWVLQPVRNKKY
jgi:hypothetical protein